MVDGQDRLDRMLRWSIPFAILLPMGIGSAIAVVNGLRARSAIRRSNYALKGDLRAWWCLIVGGIGLLAWVPLLIAIGLHQLQ